MQSTSECMQEIQTNAQIQKVFNHNILYQFKISIVGKRKRGQYLISRIIFFSLLLQNFRLLVNWAEFQ